MVLNEYWSKSDKKAAGCHISFICHIKVRGADDEHQDAGPYLLPA